MSNVIIDTKTATALVRFERDRNKIVYSDYIAANQVTEETLSAHVKALTELAYPGVKPSNKVASDTPEYQAKNFQNRVRNGLKDNLGLGKKKPEDKPESLLTGFGVTALAEMSEEQMIAAIKAELAERAK